MTPTERAEIARIVAEQCEAQGIPLRVEDPAVLRKLAALLVADMQRPPMVRGPRRANTTTGRSAVSCV